MARVSRGSCGGALARSVRSRRANAQLAPAHPSRTVSGLIWTAESFGFRGCGQRRGRRPALRRLLAAMRTRLALHCVCAKDGAQLPSSLPEPPPRRITGRVGGLSVGRQRELLKRLKVCVLRARRRATKATTSACPPPSDAALHAPQEREEAPRPVPARRSRPAPSFVQTSEDALQVRATPRASVRQRAS